MKFKCPVCKTVLTLEESANKTKCNHCESQFSTAKILELRERQAIQNIPTDFKPSISVTEKERSSSTINEHSGNILQQQNKRNRTKMVLSIGLGLVGVILTIVVVLIVQANLKAPVAQVTVPNNEHVESLPDDLPVPKASELPELDEKTSPNEPRQLVPFEQLDNPAEIMARTSSKFKAKSVLDQCWFNTKPYLVELYAETPSGGRHATGVIVNSKGWVATSYLAIKGARQIHLRRALDTSQDQQERLVDQVRGYLAVKPEHDLVLLSVNRRLVDTFEDLALDNEENAVGSQYFIQCQPPSKLSPSSTVETKLRKAATMDLLDQAVANRLQWRNFDNKVRWLFHRNNSPLKHGAPLVNDNGEMIGMNTAAFRVDESDTVALPAKYVAELIKQSSGDVFPLPVGHSDDAARPTEVQGVGKGSVESVDYIDRTLVENLNVSGESCELFNWWPEKPNEIDSFRRFIQYLVEAKQYVELDQHAEESELLKDQIQHWTKKLGEELGGNKSRSMEQQTEFNRRFVSGVTPRKPFVGFAFVSHAARNLRSSAGLGSETQAVVGFDLKGVPERFIADVHPDWPIMQTDSPWLIIGSVKPGESYVVGSNTGTEEFGSAVVEFVFQAQ